MTGQSHRHQRLALRLATRLGICATLAVVGLLVHSPAANAFLTLYTFQGSSGIDSAQAQLTVGDGSVQILLTNTESSTPSVGDEVSGIVIAMASPIGTVTLTQAFAANSNGSRNPGGLVNFPGPTQVGTTGDLAGLTTWATNGSSGTSTLGLAARGSYSTGSQPKGLITGPTTAGGPSGAPPHDPNVLNNAFFALSATGVVFNEVINSVSFFFGTGSGDATATGIIISTQLVVPEPRSIALLLTGLLGLAAVRRFRRA